MRAERLHLGHANRKPPNRRLVPTRSRSAGERLRDGAAWVRDGARFNLTLAQRLAADVLVASLLGLPEPVRRGAAADARRNAAGLCCSAFWLGDKARMASDARFYGDGFALLARDLQRDAPLLLSPGPHSERQRAARARIAADLRALVPFSLLLMNTFPWTIGLLEHPLVARGWLPRRWLLPSAFETERLSTVARARQHAKRAAAAAVTTK